MKMPALLRIETGVRNLDTLLLPQGIEAMGARRVGIDTVSVFIHEITESPRIRAKLVQLATIVQNGLFARRP